MIKQIHFKISREESTFLWNIKISQSLPMGSSSTESLRGDEAVLDRFNNSNPTFIRDPITAIYGCLPCCG
jgi:hypothetical protein